MPVCPKCQVFYSVEGTHACATGVNPVELAAGVLFGSILGAAFGFSGVAAIACSGVATGPCVVPGLIYGVPLGVFIGTMIGARVARG